MSAWLLRTEHHELRHPYDAVVYWVLYDHPSGQGLGMKVTLRPRRAAGAPAERSTALRIAAPVTTATLMKAEELLQGWLIENVAELL